MVGSYKEFYRGKNKIVIFLDPEEWPKDMPLPKDAKPAVVGSEPFRTHWSIYLEGEKTVEVVVGWFSIPRLLENVANNFQEQMIAHGWIEDQEKSFGRLSDTRWSLYYYQPRIDVSGRISLQYWSGLRETRAMIYRIKIHPWEIADSAEEFQDNDLIDYS